MEKTENRFVRRCFRKLGAGRNKSISFFLKFLNNIHIILTLRAGKSFRDIPGRTASENDIRAVIIFQIIFRQIILVGTAAGMTDHGGRRGIR